MPLAAVGCTAEETFARGCFRPEPNRGLDFVRLKCQQRLYRADVVADSALAVRNSRSGKLFAQLVDVRLAGAEAVEASRL